MGSAQLEAQYLNQLVKDTVKALGLKKNGTLLGIGEGQWEFAKLCFQEIGENAKSLLVADKDAEVLKSAEASGVPMTSTADIKDFDALASLGKYDGVIAKNVVEEVAETMTSLEDLLFSLYKTIRLRGKAVLVGRLRPTLPLPESVVAAWSEKVPDAAGLVKEAEECGFTPSAVRLAYPASVDTAVWKAHLLHGGGTRPIPFIANASKEEIEKFAASQGDKIAFKDEIDIIILHKIISRTKKED